MKNYVKPDIEELKILISDIILISFLKEGHDIFNYNDEL